MISFQGSYYDGQSSGEQAATLSLEDDGRALLQTPQGAMHYDLGTLRVSARVGNIPRAILFPDGARLDTTDNDAVDQILDRLGVHRGSRLAHLLESRWRYALAAMVLVVISSWGIYRYGIPAAARVAAFSLPAQTNQYIGTGTLEVMDRYFLKPSTLAQKTRDRLQMHFARMVKTQPDGFEYRLLFRDAPVANAFALPDGTIVMTDELVKLAENDEELIAVMAHELGHVVGRHAMRKVIQLSSVALLVVLITGDASSTSELIAALPTILIHAQYSQDFESEADRYALDYMLAHRIAPGRFVTIMDRLEASYAQENGDNKDDSKMEEYFSSHPPTDKRLLVFKAAQKKFEAARP